MAPRKPPTAPTKGQCFLMPLPTTKLSNFISCSCICPNLGDGYIGGVCINLRVHAMNIHAHIHTHTTEHTTSIHTHTYTHWVCYTSSFAISRCGYTYTNTHAIRHVAHNHNLWVRLHACHVWQWQRRINTAPQSLIKQIVIHVLHPNAVQKVK